MSAHRSEKQETEDTNETDYKCIRSHLPLLGQLATQSQNILNLYIVLVHNDQRSQNKAESTLKSHFQFTTKVYEYLTYMIYLPPFC